MGGAPHEGEGVVYPGICRGISADEVGERVARGEVFAWRFDSGKAAEVHGDLFFEDELVGLVRVDAGVNGDVVLARKDIAVGYHLAVVVDDAFQGVNLVTRGEDLLGATHVQRQLQALLGLAVPGYFHHRLLRDEAGKRLAKRDDARSIRVLRDGGISAVEVMERVRRGG